MLFGGESLFLSELKGTGEVYVQTMPFNKFANTIFNEIDFSKYIQKEN